MNALRQLPLTFATILFLLPTGMVNGQNLENRTYSRDRSLLDEGGDGSRLVGGDVAEGPDITIFSRLNSVSIYRRGESRGNAGAPEINDQVGLGSDAIAELESYLGESVAWSDLERMKSIIQRSLLATQPELTRVVLPEQEVTGGRLRFEVVASRVGQIESGNDPRVTEWLGVERGEEIDRWATEDQLEFLNRNPRRSVGLLYRPGEQFGTTDIHILLDDEDPWQVALTYDNYGVDLLGRENFGITLEHGDLFNRDVQVLYNYTGALEFDSLHAHYAALTIPFHRRRHELVWSGYYSDVETEIPLGAAGNLLSTGESWQSTLDYRVQLPRAFGRKVKQEIHAAFEAKGSEGNLEFGLINLAPTNTEIYQFNLGYLARWKDDGGSNAFRASFTGSPGGWSPQNEDAAFGLPRAGSDSTYSYFQVGFERNQKLPKNLSLHTEISAQAASDNLLPSEQLSLSGPYAVRGFEPSVARVDHGVLIQTELWFPGVVIPPFPFQDDALGNAISPYAFFDTAWGGSTHPLPGEADISLASLGLGMKFHMTQSLLGDVNYGWQVSENGFVDGDEGRFQAQITLLW